MTALTCGEWVAHCRRWNVHVAGDVVAPPEVVPFDPSTVPDWLPLTDPLNTYGGAGPLPHWRDVYQWVANNISATLPADRASPITSWGDQETMLHATAGETIKALSYFLVQDEQNNVALHNALVVALDHLELNTIGEEIQIGFILAGIPAQILEGTAAAVAQAQQQLLNGLAQMQQYVDGVAALNRQWAMDTIFKPLFENIGQAEAQATQQALQVASQIIPESQVVAATAVAPVATEVAKLAPVVTVLTAAVQALQKEATDCVEPMCAQFGPTSNFSKILKALEGLLAIGLGTSILGLTENDLLKIAQAFGGIAQGDIASFLSGFVGSGESIGAAGGGFLGDVGNVATTVLTDLGITGL